MSSFSLDMEKAMKIEEESTIRKNAAFTKVYDAISSLDIFGSGDETENNSPQVFKSVNQPISANYVSVEAIYHQSNNEKISFSEQIRIIQQEKEDAEMYKLQRDDLRKRHDNDEHEEGVYNPTDINATASTSSSRHHHDSEKINPHLAMDNNFISESALQEIEHYYGLTNTSNHSLHTTSNDSSTALDDTQKQNPISMTVNDPDLADVFAYLDSTSTKSTTTSNRKKSTAAELEALIRLRDRQQLQNLSSSSSSATSDDQVTTAATFCNGGCDNVVTTNHSESTE